MSLEDDLTGLITVNSSQEGTELAISSNSDRGPMIVHAEGTINIRIIDEEEVGAIRPPLKPSTDSDDDSVEVEQVLCFYSVVQSPFILSIGRLVKDIFWKSLVQSALIVVSLAI